MSWHKNILAVALAAAAPVASAEQAMNLRGLQEAMKVSLPGDRTDVLPAVNGTRLVTFRWSPDVSFAIRAMEGTFVNIEVPEGEQVQGLYLSDAVRWSYHVTGDHRRVLIKPLAAGHVNTGTLITDKRSYELTLLSVPPGEMWFQRVRWQVPGQAEDGLYWRGQAKAAALPEVTPVVAGDPGVAPDRLNFGWKIKGTAPFRPQAVFDDGVRTWIRLGSVQDLPAIFAEQPTGLEVVDFSVQGAYVVVPSIADRFVLRLRKDEVRIVREKRG